MNNQTDKLLGLTERVRAIQDNSSMCGEYTDEQTEELAQLAVQLTDIAYSAMRSLTHECDRLRDGPKSMIESDYVYYNDPLKDRKMGSVPPVRVQVQSLTGEGKLHFAEFHCADFRVQQNALRDGCHYVSIEFVADTKVDLPKMIREALPDAGVVRQRLVNGLPGLR